MCSITQATISRYPACRNRARSSGVSIRLPDSATLSASETAFLIPLRDAPGRLLIFAACVLRIAAIAAFRSGEPFGCDR